MTEEKKTHKKDNKEEKYYHVWTVDGIKLYAKYNVELCCCDGSLHKAGIGCM